MSSDSRTLNGHIYQYRLTHNFYRQQPSPPRRTLEKGWQEQPCVHFVPLVESGKQIRYKFSAFRYAYPSSSLRCSRKRPSLLSLACASGRLSFAVGERYYCVYFLSAISFHVRTYADASFHITIQARSTNTRFTYVQPSTSDVPRSLQVEFQPFNRSYSQLMFFNILRKIAVALYVRYQVRIVCTELYGVIIRIAVMNSTYEVIRTISYQYESENRNCYQVFFQNRSPVLGTNYLELETKASPKRECGSKKVQRCIIFTSQVKM